MQVIDGMIVVIGAFVFGPTKAMYAIVAIYIVGKVTDGLQEGLNYAKAVYIITDHQEEVSRRILEDLDRGVTGVHAQGMYAGTERLMLFSVVGKKQIVQLKEVVAQVDPKAFMIVQMPGRFWEKDFRNIRCEQNVKICCDCYFFMFFSLFFCIFYIRI